MPVQHQLDFKQAWSTLRQLKDQEDAVHQQRWTKRIKLITKIGGKALPHLGGIGKNLGGILLMSITTKTYPALIDPGKPDRKVIGPLIRGLILKIYLEQYSSKFGTS